MEHKKSDIPLLLAILVLFGVSIGILHGKIKNKIENRAVAQRPANIATKYA